MKLSREDVVNIVYGQTRSPIQRFTQDSPVLADVWIAFAENPLEPQDLLLTPYQSTLALPTSDRTVSEGALLTPGLLARTLKQRLDAERKTPRWKKWKRNHETRPSEIAYHQSTVAAKVWFDELVRVVLPMSQWYATRISSRPDPAKPGAKKRRPNMLTEVKKPDVRRKLAQWLAEPDIAPPEIPADVLWSAQVIGTIALVHEGEATNSLLPPSPPAEPSTAEERRKYAEGRRKYYERIIEALAHLVDGIDPRLGESLIYLVSLNRPVKTTVWRSTVAVKADAAARLFEISCRDLTWAIIDSGIDATHPAFRRYQSKDKPYKKAFEGGENRTRVIGTFDFTVIRELLRIDGEGDESDTVARDAKGRKPNQTAEWRKQLRQSLNSGREIDWSLLLRLIKRPGDEPPANPHGTHVAGILAADWRFDERNEPLPQPVRGMCPDINVYDLRVLGKNGGDEFSVMAALQFVRFLNQHRDVMAVHGVNLSLSIQHDVLNYACGRTPVCEECERLIGAGVVVVAAAGNEGYQAMPASLGTFSRNVYQSISITDPGNAETVITVGATHRDSPHTFGVSYFSSRGPTGDGRSKPDLVAPGEKIESSVPGSSVKRMDGTSMAAPHVSGAAALLMARYRELTGRPQRIKEILCKTAIDLGREKYFQGSGMVDVLRALQSV